ncbi:MAG: fibronectin type III domain-containing protein [Ferruginibacter sp.]|nr:fibronectin type III domain-containing protein [Ferruginibacter sp.]
MKKLITLTLIPALVFSLSLNAQQIQKGNPGMWPSFIKYDSKAPAFSKSNPAILDASGKSGNAGTGIVKNIETDAKGMVHYRYQQTINGIAVENADMVVHVVNGRISSQNGKWIKDFPAGMQSTPALSQANALSKALQHIGASTYKWELPAEEAFIKREQNNPNATFYPKATLVYYSGERDVIPSALRLAYKFDVYAQQPISRYLIFVDAFNGKILGKRELIHETNATGTAQTGFSGTQTITSDFTGANYRLREAGRGAGTSINTYNLLTGTNYAAAVDFTDADNNWNNVNAAKDEYAADAHWGTEMTYDYFYQKYNRNSIDNAGMALNSYVHYSVNYFNAFWDGNRMTYGDGDAAHGNKPLTSLDVCGHEITHGITERTSNLVYSYESGAMNEGFSDIFGTAIEAFARPGNTDWLIGGDFFTIRNMSNPNSFNHPDTYLGTHWYSGGGDNGGVHYNSGVLNYWFYLLTVGGSGVNDHSVAYNVSGIGMDKAAAIAYRLNTFYLVSTSQYYDARVLGIQAAEDLYGIGSNEAIQTANAWTAVGLYAPSCAATSGLNAANVLDRTATLKWTADPGASYYNVQYKTNSSTAWSPLISTTVDSLDLSGLTASTLYDYRVRSSCNMIYTAAQFTTAAPICEPPTGITFVTGNSSATINWNPQLYALSYDVEYKLTTDNVWTAAGNTTSTTFTITGLTAPTTYDCRIKNNCSFGSSPFYEFQFTTTLAPCNAPTGLAFSYSNNVSTFTWDAVPGALDYVFELAWAGGSWGAYNQVTTTNSHDLTGLMQGGNFQYRVTANCGGSYSLPSSTFLFTTPCSMPGSLSATAITNTSATLNWVPAVGNNNNTAFEVTYRLAGSSNAWTTVGNTTASTINVSGLTAGTTYDWRVRKLCTSLNSTYATDQFTTTGVQPACNMPTGLTSSGVTATQATVSWAAVSGAINYSVQYKPAGSSTWSTAVITTATSRLITGLSAATLYDWQVRTNCSINASSFATAQFTTTCNTPTTLSSTGITATQATINWAAVSGAVSYSVQYKAAGSSTWSTAVNTTATNHTITGLTASTLYDWRVMTNCTINTSSYASAQFTTTTANGCSVPTGLAANYITNTSTLIEWNAVSGANSYRLQYKTAAATNWTTVSNINSNLYTLSNLAMNTAYQVKISSKCGSTFTAYSPVVTFTTLNCVTSANNTAQWIDLFKVGTINRVSGADAGGYINTGLSTNLVIGSTGNAGQISAGFAGAAASNNYCVYIDFNRNGSFNDAGERVFGSGLISNGNTFNFSFNIPATATPGVTGMRVVMRKNTDGPVGPCLQGFVGEAEDYTVNLTTTAFNGFGENPITAAEIKTPAANEMFQSGIIVGPNPSTGKYNVSFNGGFNPVQYDIISTNGNLVKSVKVVSAKVLQLDITSMPAGLYLLRLTDRSGKTAMLKLIKE